MNAEKSRVAFPIYALLMLLASSLLGGCMKWDYVSPEDLESSAEGLFIVNEGNFQYGNATLSFYNPTSCSVQNEVFLRANGYKLGDVAMSMVVRNGVGWIVVNNSHVIFAIDADTFREVGRIENLTSPRFIHFISDQKAYVTQIWDNRIFIVNPSKFEITGYIQVPGMTMESGSTEQMVQLGRYLYVNCWSYQNRILKIDTQTDEIVAELVVGIQPKSLALDAYGKLWTVTDGGAPGNPYGNETPALFRIDPESLTVEESWLFNDGDSPRELQTSGDGTLLYWINDDVWQMDVTSHTLPEKPLIPSRGTIYYGLSVNPFNSEVYVADAVDYMQPGKIYRYSPEAVLIDEFYTGIIPAAFAWKN